MHTYDDWCPGDRYSGDIADRHAVEEGGSQSRGAGLVLSKGYSWV